MLIQSTSVRVPIKLVTSLGVGVTGILSTDILNGSVEVVKSDGTTLVVPIYTSGIMKNLFEIDSVQSPGLYHLLLTSSAPSLVGPLQYTIYPSATAFIAATYFETVSVDSTSLAFLYQFLTGNQKIEVGTDRLIIYQSDGVTPLIQYYLTDQNIQPSLYNIFNKTKVV